MPRAFACRAMPAAIVISAQQPVVQASKISLNGDLVSWGKDARDEGSLAHAMRTLHAPYSSS